MDALANGTIVFDPLLPWAALAGLAALTALVLMLGAARGLLGAGLRALGAVALLAALANPSLQEADRDPLSDIVIVVVDRSASQRISDRPDQTEAALADLTARLEARENTEIRVVDLDDAPDNAGSLAMTALSEALAELPRARVAGAVLITDGQVHDTGLVPDMPAPVHVLLTGKQDDWDRRLKIETAPAFAIMGEETVLTLRIDDDGAVPATLPPRARLRISIDGADPIQRDVAIGRDLEIPLALPHAGINVIRIDTPVQDGELTDRNNAAVIRVNGVRDRLRVLLVSGEPHAGERTWRNLLKSDSAVDLVHFTILRPPEKQDGVPVAELSLIAFPTRELFLEKIDDFDLIIFDRYRRRGILPSVYLDNVARYVEDGGAVLVAAGPDYASANSLYRSPLASILPGEPTGQVLEQGFTPLLTDLGHRHPVTRGLTPPEADPDWGRWFRQIELVQTAGDVAMTGIDDKPLLILDRVGEGRVALLASDQAWLWARGFEGGGPQLELLRRLAHWSMKEPELEEEALIATAEGLDLTVTRRALEGAARDVVITAPDGTETVLSLDDTRPGEASAVFTGTEPGLYRLTDGDLDTVAALGPAAPKEFETTLASAVPVQALVDARRGGVVRIEDGLPSLRDVREGRVAAGRGWIGLTPRDAAVTTSVRITPILAAWLALALVAGLTILGWLREGRN